jgi:phosphatidylglycerol:prolipoprotein diacylglycerol transferase
MYPVLYQSSLLTVTSYGLMLVLSFIAGTFLAQARAARAGVEAQQILRLGLLILLAAVAGSRALYVGEHPSFYAANPSQALRLGDGGLSMYGGLFLAIAVSAWYARAIGEPFATLADICAPSIALGEGLTRIGCFFNGCCFGTPCHLPSGVVFPRHSLAGQVFPDMLIHPTQLYSSLYSLLIFGTLLAVERKRRAPGFTIGVFLLLHATARFLVEFLRYHESACVELNVGNVQLTSAQLISVAVFALGTYFLSSSKTGMRRQVP